MSGRPLINYVSIDPAEGGKEANSSWWALEVWQVDPTNRLRFMVYGVRGRWTISEILSHSESKSESGGFSGVLEDITFKCATIGVRLSAMVIEQNAAHTFLQQRDFDQWRRSRWSDLKVIPFQTGKNKNDALLHETPNSSAGNLAFKLNKLDWYQKSPYALTRAIAERLKAGKSNRVTKTVEKYQLHPFDEWSPLTLEERHKMMVGMVEEYWEVQLPSPS